MLVETKEIKDHPIKLNLTVCSKGGVQGGVLDSDLERDVEDPTYNAALNGIESLILAQACAGIDVTTQQYSEALTTALDALDNNS